MVEQNGAGEEAGDEGGCLDVDGGSLDELPVTEVGITTRPVAPTDFGNLNLPCYTLLVLFHAPSLDVEPSEGGEGGLKVCKYPTVNRVK